MSMTDPIADFLARIRNGIRARKQLVECPRSNIKLRIAEILRDEGFVQSVVSIDDNKQGTMTRTITVPSDVTGEQLDGLTSIAERTPVTVAIQGGTPISTTFVQEDS